MPNRRAARQILVGQVSIGGDAPISVQSMTNVRAEDFDGTYAQIKALERAGCDIVRVSIPNMDAVRVLSRLKESDIRLPIVADIHFDYKMAVESVAAGADKIRINPGNIGSNERVREVVRACEARKIPIRVGINSGSLEHDLLAKFGGATAAALAESALRNAALTESFGFSNIVLSIKASDPPRTIEANRLVAERCDYPLHIGVTESGAGVSGVTRSAVGVGTLLALGIGDTVRVSLTDDPVAEIVAAREILLACGRYEKPALTLVSCPTCGRTRINLIELSERFKAAARERIEPRLTRSLKIALMGCAVNGPGEAADADFGIAGGDGEALLFARGAVLRKIKEDGAIDALVKEIEKSGALS